MRICIAGAGVGGMTLAALLAKRGVDATIVERAPNFEHAGYMLGLYPLGYRVLHGIGLFDEFRARSVEARYFEVFDGEGSPINRWAMDPFMRRFGPILSSTRPHLVDVLASSLSAADLRMNTALTGLTERPDHVEVELSSGAVERFDLLVAADGIGSHVRSLLFGEQTGYDTGWGGWVWFAERRRLPDETFAEFWGAGRFLGAYPTIDGVGVFAGAPVSRFPETSAGRREGLLKTFAPFGELAGALLDDLPGDDADMFFWKLADVRSERWRTERVVLLGDSAAGFLPTAGVGASMAMESAAVLNDELSRTNAESIPRALQLFETRRRARVEGIQADSRKLARMMFVEHGTLAAIRNVVTKFYSLDMMAADIARSFEAPI